MKPKLNILLICLISIIACKDDNSNTDDPIVEPMEFQYEADPPGQWFMGDFHVHATGASNDTGGDSFPEDIKEKAIEIGLDFVVLTDHSNSTGSDASTTEEDPALFNQGPEFPYWDKAAELSEPGVFLMICGNEISPVDEETLNNPVGHIGCIPQSLENFQTEGAFIDRPKGAVSGGYALEQANLRDCFSIVNHAYSPFGWIRYDWTNMEYHAIEIWNGTVGYDPSDEEARQAWLCDLVQGKMTVPIAASDCHRVNTPAPGMGLNPALGYAATAVFAESLDWDLIMTSLKEGNVVLCEGDSRLFLDTYNENGKRVNTDFSIIRIRGTADANLYNPTLRLYHTTNCVDPRPSSDEIPALTETIVYEQSITAGESFDIRIDTASTKGVYTATLFGENQAHYAAFSRAIVVN